MMEMGLGWRLLQNVALSDFFKGISVGLAAYGLGIALDFCDLASFILEPVGIST